MKIKLILEKSSTGYSAYSEELPGLVTTGETFEEVKTNFKEVVDMQCDYLREEGKLTEADELESATVNYYLDLQTFFDYFSIFNKSKLADYLGINSSLLRRMSVNDFELSEKKALQIQDGLHKLAEELKDYHFI